MRMSRRLEYLVIGLVAGFAGGLVVGLLFAPSSGAKTRRKLVWEANRLSDVARDMAERLEETAGTVGERFEHYMGRDEQLAWKKLRELREGVDRYTESHPAQP